MKVTYYATKKVGGKWKAIASLTFDEGDFVCLRDAEIVLAYIDRPYDYLHGEGVTKQKNYDGELPEYKHYNVRGIEHQQVMERAFVYQCTKDFKTMAEAVEFYTAYGFPEKATIVESWWGMYDNIRHSSNVA